MLMSAKKRTFKVGQTVKFISRAQNEPRFEVTGKITRLFIGASKLNKRASLAEVAVARGSKWNRLTKLTLARVKTSSLI